MDKRNVTIIKVYVLVLISINIFLLISQFNISDWGKRPDLDFSKDFANEIVSNMQGLATMLGVEERVNVKHALAQLHYDVYLVGNRSELAAIVQSDASDARDLIVSEYVNSSGEQVLLILNDAQEVQRINSRTIIAIEPLAEGGLIVQEPHNLSEETMLKLSNVPTLFHFEYFRNLFESYRSLSSFQVEVEAGTAQLSTPNLDQDTIRYWEKEIQTMRNEYGRISQNAGFADISGTGISLSLYDMIYNVEAVDLRRVVGELYSAGATAISVGGHRLAVNSYIVDVSQGISIDGMIIDTNPVLIQVIGDPPTLTSGIDLLFSVTMRNMFYVDTKIHDRIVLPAKTIQ